MIGKCSVATMAVHNTLTDLFCALASCLLSAYSAHTRCESTNSLSHGRIYLHTADQRFCIFL